MKPYLFDNFILPEDDVPVVLDLAINHQDKEDELSVLLKNIDARLKILLADDSADKLRLIKMFLQQLSPALLQQQSLQIVADFISSNFPEFGQEKLLNFYLHPSVIYRLQELISSLAQKHNYEGKILLHKDENLAVCDCRIEWKNGQKLYDSKHILSRLESLIGGSND